MPLLAGTEEYLVKSTPIRGLHACAGARSKASPSTALTRARSGVASSAARFISVVVKLPACCRRSGTLPPNSSPISARLHAARGMVGLFHKSRNADVHVI